MNTFFKIIGAVTLVAGVGYAVYRLYDRKYTNEFLFKKCKCNKDKMDFCEEECDDDTVYFDDIDDIITEDEIVTPDNNE